LSPKLVYDSPASPFWSPPFWNMFPLATQCCILTLIARELAVASNSYVEVSVQLKQLKI
jgi:hypothetical protein